MTHKSWVPMQDGKIYCSSACGRGCTLAEYEAAVKASEELAKHLGEGFEPRVWENLGWHWEVTGCNGRLKIHLGEQETTVYLDLQKQFVVSRSTPEGAIESVFYKARKWVGELNSSLAVCEQGVKNVRLLAR